MPNMSSSFRVGVGGRPVRTRAHLTQWEMMPGCLAGGGAGAAAPCVRLPALEISAVGYGPGQGSSWRISAISTKYLHSKSCFPSLLSFGSVETYFPMEGKDRPLWKHHSFAQATVKVNRKQETSKRDKEHHRLPISMDVFINV